MPKLKNRPPKYSKLKNFAVVYYLGKTHYLGQYGSQESRVAYARFIAEIQEDPILSLPKNETNITVKELSAAFLDHAKVHIDPTTYDFYRIIVLDFIDKLYGDNTFVGDFKPSCLKLVRSEMVKSRRFCRNIVNRHTRRAISIFEWGVENDIVPETTWRALKTVKSLPKGYPGTFDHKERKNVPDSVIKATLPFLPPTLQAMVKLQRLTGLRPSEVFNMKVREITKDTDPELWYYTLESHKTEEHIGKKAIPLGKPEQVLIAPYLIGKKADAAVFSPRTAQEERNAEKRANRKTKITPSQAARNKSRAEKPFQYAEFYNRNSYRQAIEYAIDKGNKSLPNNKKIPYWTPYCLRNSAATAAELEFGLDGSQALLAHKTADMTRRYSNAQLSTREKLARERRDPFSVETPPAQ